ncbi:MAG: DUF1569 domain-containing protein [Myxococcales bacterium]|nr:DUF1569 domain-containing protein [Myxococcales bacterium]MCB9566918.1 DUF1569 domain-containing protein [Myxococcales bacterium]MCB9704651.1 DUF1569 domain-containing protein [Myxococcales bacterium]
MSEPLRLTNIDEALDHLRSIESAPMISTSGPWSLHQIMEHCRQSVEYSLDGFPTLKPAIVRRTVGGWAGRRFLRRGHLGHRTDAAIPGAPEVTRDGDGRRAVTRLIAALERFVAADPESVKPHFIFGALTKEEYERLHLMHIAEHVAEVHPSALLPEISGSYPGMS